jgi:alpha-ketoglutarate-dependent taurine dioxygenase
MTLHVELFPQGFGAEITGFDAENGRSQADVNALQAALLSHGLLLFRDCGRLSPQRQAEMVGWFGTVNVGSLPEEVATTMDNVSQ